MVAALYPQEWVQSHSHWLAPPPCPAPPPPPRPRPRPARPAPIRTRGQAARAGRGADGERGAGAGAVQGVPQHPHHLGRLAADLARRKVQHDDAGRAHQVVPLPGPVPVRRRQVPLVGIDLRGHTGLRPPRVRLGQEVLAEVERGVPQRLRQLGRPDQGAQVALGGGPDAVGHLSQHGTEHRRAPHRPVAKLTGQVRHRASPLLNGLRDHRPHVPHVGQQPRGVRHRSGRQHETQRIPGHEPRRQVISPVQPNEPGAASLPPHRYQHVGHLQRHRTAHAVVHQGHRPGDDAPRPGVEQRRRLLLQQGRCPGQA